MGAPLRRLPLLLLLVLALSPEGMRWPAAAAAAARRIAPLPTAALRRLYDTSNYGRLQLHNGLALSPQMGWNSWNFFACNINDTLIRETGSAPRGIPDSLLKEKKAEDPIAFLKKN
ncbi:alpha-galactosidase-like [Triticum aestivum]|uniref:alpha-galactosidase-like n=1 Tax=Triticum aestivum TaxID=4565 RepID=UPI001D012059|nr:alpha-galactosidase-like [Triticum aestivum]